MAHKESLQKNSLSFAWNGWPTVKDLWRTNQIGRCIRENLGLLDFEISVPTRQRDAWAWCLCRTLDTLAILCIPVSMLCIPMRIDTRLHWRHLRQEHCRQGREVNGIKIGWSELHVTCAENVSDWQSLPSIEKFWLREPTIGSTMLYRGIDILYTSLKQITDLCPL